MIVPKVVYFRVAFALLVLFIMTVIVAFVDLGSFNIFIALTIAVAKAVLVVLYFMHVRYSSRITWVFALAGFFWLLIMFALAMSDYLTRS